MNTAIIEAVTAGRKLCALCVHKWMGAGKTASLPLLALFALAALPSLAAGTSIWQGGTSGVWGVGYESNWTAYPDSDHYATFANPSDDPITVTVNETVDAYGVQSSTGRKANVKLTGTGTINSYRATLYANNGAPVVVDFDVNVDSKYDQWNTYIDGEAIFRKALNITGEYINTKDKAKVTLCDSAQLTVNHGLIVAGSSFEILDSATATFAKDLKFEPGASFRIADNAVLNVRGLFLPFSQEEGVDEEWVMEGGEVRPSTTDGSSRVELAYTNATKTVSGTGTFYMYRFNLANSYNLVFRLMGPNMYVRDGYISSSSPAYNKNQFEIGGGSTIGLWGADALFDRWTNRVVGAATVDTTDYADKTTPRTLTLSKFFDCNGVLTVKGIGTCSLSSPDQPNLSIVGTETSTTTCGNGYALGDIVLTDSAKFTCTEYMGHKTEESFRNVKSLTMDEDSSLNVKRYVILSGDATLSGNASAVVRNGNGETDPIFTCDNLSLSDNASLSVTGTIAATSLAMSGNSHLAFTAGTAFSAGATFGDGNWTMEIKIPSGYEAGIRPVVLGAGFEGDFADHVTLIGDTTGWSAQTLDGSLVLYKDAPPSGIEWIGKSASSDNWSDAANWNDGNVPTAGDCVAFGGLDRRTPYNDSVSSVSSIVFRASAGPFVLSGNDLSLTASSGGRGSVTVASAGIVSHSSFDQTIESFVNFGKNHTGIISDGGGALKMLGGFTAPDDWKYFVVGGNIIVGGTCSVGILSFKKSTTAMPSCLRVLPGATFTCSNQYYRGLVESTSYLGRFVVENGGTVSIQNGDCAFWYGGLENVIDGTLIVKGTGSSGIGRLVGGPSEQYYAGTGVIYADSARSARNDTAASHYINIGGTLKLYMNGDWMTASYALEGENVAQNPNYPTRFRMKDGTTLGATKDWTYGPAADAYDVIANTLTPDDRKSIMVGTVTVNTQNPTNDTAHTITFVDPLDASNANLVKAGSGTLAFNPTNGCPSQVSNLTVNAGRVLFAGDSASTVGDVTANGGEVRFDVVPTTLIDMTVGDGATASFSSAPELSGTLTISSTAADFCVDGLAETMAWQQIATAADIVGPGGATKWDSTVGKCRFKIVSDGTGKALYGSKAGGFAIIVR
jgi:hypothetical protein